MTLTQLDNRLTPASAIELKPGCRYILFMDASLVNPEDLIKGNSDSDFDADIQIIFTAPGQDITKAIAAFEIPK